MKKISKAPTEQKIMVFPRLILVLYHGAGKTLDLDLEGASVRVKG